MTSSLHSVLRERDEAQRTSPAVEREQRQPGKTHQDEINQLVSAAMSDIQQDIDLQSLIDSSMAEFAGIHQQQLKQQEQLKQAMLQKQRELETPKNRLRNLNSSNLSSRNRNLAVAQECNRRL